MLTGTVRDQSDFFFAFPGDFKQQSDVDEPLANADINILLPLVDTGARPQIDEQTTQRFMCDGVHVRKTIVDTELLKWNFSVQPSARMYAGFMSLVKGAISAWSGAAVNEIKILNSTGTGGSFKLGFVNFEGRTGKTRPIAWNATAAEIKAALEALDIFFEASDIASVTGSLAAGLSITFGGRYANSNLPDFAIDNTLLTGGAVTQNTTTSGSNRILTITRAGSREMALISYVTGYKSDPSSYEKHFNQVVNSVTFKVEKAKVSSIDVEIVGSTRVDLVPDFVVPQCVNYDPVSAHEIRYELSNVFIPGDTRSFTHTVNNNLITDTDAYVYGKFMDRFRRGRIPTETVALAVDGSEADDIHKRAKVRGIEPLKVYIGTPNERAILTLPTVELSLNGKGVEYTGNGDTYVSVNGQPTGDNVLESYSKVDYQAATGAAFLDI